MKSPSTNKQTTDDRSFSRLWGITLAATLALPCVALTQQEVLPQDAQFEYVEHWTAQIPPTEFPEPRADLKDEDIVLFHRLTRVEQEGTARIGMREFYFFDKVTGDCISLAEVRGSEMRSVKGATFYKGKVWIVIGHKEEIAAGTNLLVVDYRTGEQVQNHNLWGPDLNAADVPPKLLPVGDYLFATSGYAMEAPSMASRGSIGIGIRVYDATTAEHVGNLGLGDFRHNHRNFGDVMEWIEPLQGQTLMMGMYPVHVREDYVEFLDLTAEKLGPYEIGQPHVIHELGNDLYLAGWFYSQLPQTGVPVRYRKIHLGRIYRWSPGSDPEMLWDSMIQTGVNFVGGVLKDGRFWMHDEDHVVHLFNANFLMSGTRADRLRAIPQLRNSGTIYSGPLVLADPDGEGFRLALYVPELGTKLIDLHDKIKFDPENFDWIVDDNNIIGYSTKSTPEQTIITYGQIRIAE